MRKRAVSSSSSEADDEWDAKVAAALAGGNEDAGASSARRKHPAAPPSPAAKADGNLKRFEAFIATLKTKKQAGNQLMERLASTAELLEKKTSQEE